METQKPRTRKNPKAECQNFDGTANANIWPLRGWTGGASSTKVKRGEESTPCIRAELISKLIGVRGDAGVAGDVVFEWLGEGVLAMDDVDDDRWGVWFCCGGGGGFVWDVDDGLRCWPKLGIAVVVTEGSGTGVAVVEAAARAARFETEIRG